MAHSITSYRTWSRVDEDYDETLRTDEGSYPCEPDDIDTADGLTAVDLAVTVLAEKLYVIYPSSSSPDHHTGMWYSRTDEPDSLAPDGATHEETTAHLAGFTPEEEARVFAGLTARGALVP